MVVTLWEERAFQFQEAMAATDSSAKFVVITGLIAKKNSGSPMTCYLLYMHVKFSTITFFIYQIFFVNTFLHIYIYIYKNFL